MRGRLLKSFAITLLMAGAMLAAWHAPAICQDFTLEIPNFGDEAKVDAEPKVARLPEPIPLPLIASPVNDDQLTLTEAESRATEFHPALREAEAHLRAAHGNWVQVGLRPNPEVGYAGNEIGNDGTAGQQGGYISQEFVTGGKLDLNRAVAMREQAAIEQRLEQARLQVITTVRKRYFESLAADRAVALARQLNEIATQAVKASELRLQRMDVPKTALLQSQVESESASLLEQQATERSESARERLAAAIGAQNHEPAKLEDVFARPLPEIDLASTRERLMQESPELAELRFAVERARWKVARETAGRAPNVNVQAGVQYDNAAQYTIANVQLSMPIPVFDRNQGAIAQACGELAAAQAAVESRELAIQERLTIAMRDYRTARERVAKYAEKILPAAKESLDMINTGYQQGELDYTQVLTVQQTYAAKNLSYLQDLETAWQQWAEIEGLLVGEVWPGSIDRASRTLENTGGRQY